MRGVRRALKRLSRVWVFVTMVVVGTSAGALYLWYSNDHRLFVPGQTTHAHHQIEMACHACHTPFEGVKQEACLGCHAEQLRKAKDTHPVSKFSAPTVADARDNLDATRCVSCHKEHAPAITRDVAVTQPTDFCVHCHADVTKDRPSHRTFKFVTCGTAGCHNYHDNTALSEDALAAGRGAPALLPRPMVLLTGRDGPRAARHRPTRTGVIPQWESSAHARAAVNCPKCHEVRDATSAAPRWIERPGHATCAKCHENEVEGFLGGLHGMRLHQGLSAMTPAMARLPMKADAMSRPVTCASCHGVHVFDTRRAAVEGCLTCHDDQHSLAYIGSPHEKTWRAEMAGQAAPGSGVSCATCHLPRATHVTDGKKRVVVQHNQNDNLRPTAKMLRTVCLNCHGLSFALDALADRGLARKNYAGRPSRHVESIDMVTTKLRGTARKAP